MAKRVFTSQGLTYTATAAGSVATTSGYMNLKGGTTTQLLDVLEIFISGKATASTVAAMNYARVSTLEATPTTLAAPHSDGPMFSNTSALASPAVAFVAASTQPIPSNTVTDAKLNLALNLFGGIVRWSAAPGQEWKMVGNAVTTGSSILWNSTSGGGSTGLADAHIIYEPY